MVMPVWDHNPFEWPRPPYMMWALIVINFGIFFWMAGLSDDQVEAVSQSAGLIPLALTHGGPPGVLPPPLTLITSMFVHGNFMHVFGNMIFLFVFGDDIEEALGHWRFLAFYLLCGVGAEVLQYVNRLSDFLFVASRHANAKGARDVLWQPGQNR